MVERLLYNLPVLFNGEDASGNAKWRFCGFENLRRVRVKRHDRLFVTVSIRLNALRIRVV